MPQCQAKSKSSGGQCRRSAVKGKRVCRVHGGASTGPKKHTTQKTALKHGIYASGLSDEELAMWAEVQVGNVDEELRLCRIKLRRALIAQAEIQVAPISPNNPAGFELWEIRSTESGTQTVTRRSDYAAIIDRLLGRIGQLEKIRAELISAAQTTNDSPTDRAREIAAAFRAMLDTELPSLPVENSANA